MRVHSCAGGTAVPGSGASREQGTRWPAHLATRPRPRRPAGEVPVGALVLAPDGTVLAEAANRVEADHDASAHAELLALRAAAARAVGSPRLPGCTLVVTLEPCPMCAAAARPLPREPASCSAPTTRKAAGWSTGHVYSPSPVACIDPRWWVACRRATAGRC